jgi:hypothetical protein
VVAGPGPDAIHSQCRSAVQFVESASGFGIGPRRTLRTWIPAARKGARLSGKGVCSCGPQAPPLESHVPDGKHHRATPAARRPTASEPAFISLAEPRQAERTGRGEGDLAGSGGAGILRRAGQLAAKRGRRWSLSAGQLRPTRGRVRARARRVRRDTRMRGMRPRATVRRRGREPVRDQAVQAGHLHDAGSELRVGSGWVLGRAGVRHVPGTAVLWRWRAAERVRLSRAQLRAARNQLRDRARRLRGRHRVRHLSRGACLWRGGTQSMRNRDLRGQDLRAAWRYVRNCFRRLQRCFGLRRLCSTGCLRRVGRAQPMRLLAQDVCAAGSDLRPGCRGLRRRRAVRLMRACRYLRRGRCAPPMRLRLPAAAREDQLRRRAVPYPVL